MTEKKGANWKKYIIGFWMLLITGIAAVVLMFILIAKGQLGFMPTFDELENSVTKIAHL